MAIRINHVGVRNLGPLSEFDRDLKPINLIYGRNEHGKTYLVEFMYRSLFKNLSINTRINTGVGQISVSGLDKQSVSFSPSIKKKLEDFWEDSIPGLPRDFSKLLVVKGADLDFTSSDSAGIDDAILKEFLSGEGLLEKIEKRLGKTESSAIITQGKISGQKRGEIQKYNEYREQIDKIDSLFQKINQSFSEGPRYQIKQEIANLNTVMKELENAKRYLAYKTDKNTDGLKAQRLLSPDRLIEELNQLVTRYMHYKKDLEKKAQDLKVNEEKSKHFPWIDSALEEYQKLVTQTTSKKTRTSKIWLIVFIVTALLSIVLILLKQPYISIGAIVVALVSVIIYQIRQSDESSNGIQLNETEKIEKEYKERFGSDLTGGITTLNIKQKELLLIYSSLEQSHKDVENIKFELYKLEQEISGVFKQFNIPAPEIYNWENAAKELTEKNKFLDGQIQKNNIELAKLGVEPEDFLEEPILVNYDRELLKNTERLLEEKKESLKVAEEELQRIKQAVCEKTNSDISTPWEELIEKLQITRSETVIRYKDSAASIIAQIKLNEVLADLRDIESDRIEQGLNSQEVQQAVKITTQHYSIIEKEKNEIFVSDQFGRYKLKDLSTGAREQVLLGLRIGFASRILAGKTLFLILDDAFQHSDWERRESLVEELFVLADRGWQIIYFTMDDHIRKLFENRSKQIAEDEYQTILLDKEVAAN